MQKAPFHQSHVYGQIKILQTSFEKGHPSNIPVQLFQNLKSSFGEEDFLRISWCPYTARSPHLPEPCLWTDQIFANIFEKSHPRNISVKLFKNLTSGFGEEDFLWISSCPYRAKPCLLTDQNCEDNFWKGSPKEHSCAITSKSEKRFRRRRFF